MGEWKVKFRVFETKKCRKCRRIHPAPTNRVVFHQGTGTEHDVIQEGHALWVAALQQEKGRQLRPYFQYTIPLGG
jgi:hypothetical protein